MSSVKIPEFPFFAVDKPEEVFGCPESRYLRVSKSKALDITDSLSVESRMADLLFFQGHLGEEQYGMEGRELLEGTTPDGIRASITALLRSWGPSHEVKMATVAVALHR